jgi:hypothetical protein
MSLSEAPSKSRASDGATPGVPTTGGGDGNRVATALRWGALHRLLSALGRRSGDAALDAVMAVGAAGLLFVFLWFRDLPLVDLPQHAAQLAVWLRLNEPGSPEARHFALNLRTPYLLAYPIARAVAPWCGAVVALKLVVWLAVVANMLALRVLARRLGHDPWIALLGFVCSLGLCFYWGFISFMAAVPLVVISLKLAVDHAERPTWRSGISLALTVSLTLLAHGVAFGMLLAVIVPLLVTGKGSFIARLSPLSLAALVLGAWILPGPASVRIGGDYWQLSWVRLYDFPSLLVGIGSKDHAAVAFGCVLLLAVFFTLGFRPVPHWLRVAPLVGLLLGYAFFPVLFRGIALLHTRLPSLLLPLLLLALCPPPPRSERSRRRLHTCLVALVAVWFLWFGVRLRAFRAESDSYHALTRRLPAGLSMRPLIFDRESKIFPGVPAFLHYSAYYYVEKGGWQGYSFAMYPISVVRYRAHVTAGMQNAAEWRPDTFNSAREVPAYQYFLVRSEIDRSEQLFRGAPIPVELQARVGPWWGYVRKDVALPEFGDGG